MAGTIAAAAKSKLVGENNVLQALLDATFNTAATKVIVGYDMPRDVPRRVVFGGEIGGPVELESMGHDGTNRVGREEHLTLQLHIQVNEPGHKTTEVTTTRAVAISTVVENYIALDGTLGGLANLLAATVDAVNIRSGLNDDGATTLLTLTIGLESHLT